MRSALHCVALTIAVAVGCTPLATAPIATTTPSPTRTLPPGLSLEPYYSQYVATGLDMSRFSARWDARDFEGIYRMTDDRLRNTMTEPRFYATLSAARERFGASGRTREIRHEVRPLPGGDDVEVTLVMSSMFEKGPATETFVWRVTPTNVTYLVSFDIR
jgi:hypothetical protein